MNWAVECFDAKRKGKSGYIRVFDGHQEITAVKFGPGIRSLNEAAKMARMIAAAPGLLVALKLALPVLVCGFDLNSLPPTCARRLAVDAARAAIAEAEAGE